MTGRGRVSYALALACALLLLPLSAWGFDPFTVRDIQVEGVQRTEAGTIFSYLPIKVGERIDDQKVAEAVKALYATGFFRDVRIEAQGDVLVVIVQERPTISSLTFVGNKEFDNDTIKKALKDVGIGEALIFDRSALERSEQELKRQYITRGKYAATVQTTVTPQDRNRVAINFNIVEGDTASIARINIVGNKAFSEKQLRSEMQLTTPNWLSWYTKDDQYSKQKLTGDLEALRSFYQNRGYLEFNVESTQVSISPDKEDVFITVNLVEGPRYTVSGISVLGDLVVPESEIRGLIKLRPGDSFSRSNLQSSVKDISERMGIDGYAFANVNAVPDIDRAKATVAFAFYVDPGRRAYVRRINISGNSRTRDEVIRRELRQLEDGWYDGARIERSKVRVRRLGYFEEGSVNLETPPVAGTLRPGGHRHHRGREEHRQRARGRRLLELRRRGVQRVDFAAEHLRVRQRALAGAQHQQHRPHHFGHVRRAVLDGRRHFAGDRDLRQVHGPHVAVRSRNIRHRRFGAAISFGIPVSEIDAINLGFRAEHTNLTLFQQSPPIYYEFVRDFGYATNSYILSGGWSRDTRNDILYPTFGRLQSFISGGRPAVRRPCLLQAQLPESVVLAGVWRTGNDAESGPGLWRWLQRQALPVLQGVLCGRRGIGARLRSRDAGAARRLWQHAGRQAQDRRHRRGRVSGDQGREIGAGRRVLRRRTDLRQRHAAGVRELPLFDRHCRGLEFADRAAQVQLCLSAQFDIGGPHPALPIPGGAGLLGHRPAACRRRTS